MNFCEIYNKIQNGTATEDEQKYFISEVEKVQKIEALLVDDANSVLSGSDTSSVIAPADIDTVHKARKAFNSRLLVRVVIITLVILLTIAAIVCGIIFIPSISSAKRNENITETDAILFAGECLSDNTGRDISEFYINDIDKELGLSAGLTKSVYLYEIEFCDDSGNEYEITVNAKSGFTYVSDIDIRHHR